MTLPKARRALRDFARDRSGGLIIFSLFMIVCMALAVGIGIDTMRFEVQRTKIQGTADRAVLAAADLDEARDPTDVVNEYFRRNGLSPEAIDVSITPTAGGKTVTASSPVRVPTFFLNMVGIPTLEGPAISTANETETDIEIVLVLDNSGSMGSDDKIGKLKVAAKNFIDEVLPGAGDPNAGEVAVSIVPFATQVVAGPELTGYFNVSSEHALSHCVTWEAEDFEEAVVATDTPLRRTGHIDPWSYNAPVRNERLVCPRDASREITLWSDNAAALKSKIDAMWAGGNTSIDVASKWAMTLLDPSTRDLLDQKIAEGSASAALQGMPFDHDRPATRKYMVVMTDGQNTDQYDVTSAYRAGTSMLFENATTGDFAYVNRDTGRFYQVVGNGVNLLGQLLPAGSGTEAIVAAMELLNYVELTHAEANDRMAARRLARYVRGPAEGGSWTGKFWEMVSAIPAADKNSRTSEICRTARDQGVTVYTIGVGTYGQGDATLLDCVGGAAGSSFFYDLDTPDQMYEAFQSIARQINALRLTQ